LLVTAALAAAPQAREAWELWAEEFELNALDEEGYWILPLLYCSLVQAGIEHADRPRIAGVYKQMCLRNAIALPCLQEVLDELDQRQCDVLPGPLTSLVLAGEDAIALEPGELLVAMDYLEAAHSVLQSCGWKPLMPLPPRLLQPFVTSVRYRHDKAGDLFMCWRPFGLDCPVEEDASLWRRAKWSESGIRLADPTDCLLMAAQRASFLQLCVVLHRLSHRVNIPAWAGREEQLGLAPIWARLPSASGKELIAGIPDCLVRSPLNIEIAAAPDNAASLSRLITRHWQRYRRCPAAQRPSSFISYLGCYYRYTWQTPGLVQFVSKAIQRAVRR